jgi:hypothetical protein
VEERGITKVMMTFHLTVLHFLPLNPAAPYPVPRTPYPVLRTLYSALCTLYSTSSNPPQLFRPPVSPGAPVSVLDSYCFQSYT